jgi:hypothetical protein
MTTMETQSYPLRFDVEYPERLSRLLIFFKGLLAIPHLLVLYALSEVVSIMTMIAWFAILFTGRYPKGLFDFVVGVSRWSQNVAAYVLFLRDEYPPFSMEAGRYPVTYEVEYPEKLSRLLIFFKWLLILPNLIVLLLVFIAYSVTLIIAWFAILFSGRYPEGLFKFAVGTLRWGARVNAYVYLLRDEYPPFGMAP